MYNAARPLECSGPAMAVLVDEASMLDMTLAAALLDALPTDRPVQLVLVGATPASPLTVPASHAWLLQDFK